MKKIIVLILVLLLNVLVAQAQELDYIVGLKRDMPRQGKVRKEFPNLKAYHTRLTKKDADALRKDKRVKYVEENRQMKLEGVQVDAPWNLARIDQRGSLGIPADTNYNYNTTGDAVTVYVIDVGVWLEHPDFEGRAVAGMGDHTDMTTCGAGHGTHVAGIIGSKTYGVAKKARIVSLRIATCAEPALEVYKLIEALDWIAAQKATKNETRVVNISITGAGASPAVESAIDAVREKKVIVVVAAGNSAYDACSYFPAGYGPALTVGATYSDDARWSGSNYGPCVDIFAPGLEIVSTWNSSTTPSNTLSGTSMASPHVAGAAALYLETHRRAAVSEVEAVILTNSTKNALTNVGEGSPNSLLYSLFF